jgi:gas vesicle protein
MKTETKRPVVVVERSGSGVGAFLLGALLGAGVALLFAPQSGEETRRVIRERGRRLRHRLEAAADDLQERAEEGYESAKQRLEEGFESVRRNIEEKRAGAHDALDAGRAAVHSAREELERRLSESRARRRPNPAEEVAE